MQPETMIIMVIMGALIYFLPWLYASIGDPCDNSSVVLLICLFFGWTLIGWLVAVLIAEQGKKSFRNRKTLEDLLRSKNHVVVTTSEKDPSYNFLDN